MTNTKLVKIGNSYFVHVPHFVLELQPQIFSHPQRKLDLAIEDGTVVIRRAEDE